MSYADRDIYSDNSVYHLEIPSWNQRISIIFWSFDALDHSLPHKFSSKSASHLKKTPIILASFREQNWYQIYQWCFRYHLLYVLTDMNIKNYRLLREVLLLKYRYRNHNSDFNKKEFLTNFEYFKIYMPFVAKFLSVHSWRVATWIYVCMSLYDNECIYTTELLYMEMLNMAYLWSI